MLTEEISKLRKRVREQREREWIRDALLLRDRTPEDTIKTMFDLIKFAERLHRKCEP